MIYLGDHDPSGVEMDRDLEHRLALYARRDVEFKRVALTTAQVRRHRLPPNPVKERDANAGKYRRQFGTDECWELDALNPTLLSDLLRRELEKMIEPEKWRRFLRREQRNRAVLRRAARDLS